MNNADRPNRRDFLQGRAAVQALASAVGGAAEVGADRSPADLGSGNVARRLGRGGLMSVCRRAMACEFEVQLAAGRADGSTERVLAALDLVESLEAQMTIYRG